MSPITLACIGGLTLLCMIWGMVLHARRKRVVVRAPKPKLIHSINDDRCIACDACVDVCPTDVLELVSAKSRPVRFDDCIQCNQCEIVCPTSALVMHRPGVEPPQVRMPLLDACYQARDGLYLIGEAAGKPLVKNASNLGRAVVEHMVQSGLRPGASDGLDVLIVGSGPGGLSAALSCLEHGLSHVILEKDEQIASTIARYPKGKHVMAEPREAECLGHLPVFDATKEELLATWMELVRERRVQISLREPVEAIEPDGAGFQVRSILDGKKRAWRAQRVVVAIGTRGKPRTLGVPGDQLPKVMPLLRDPDEHVGQRVLVVGGGDSAVEAAVALAGVARQVILSYRGKALSRCKAQNRKRLDEAVRAGQVQAIFGSNVVEIRDGSLTLKVGDQARELPNDHVIAAIGGDAPVRWLERIGVQFAPHPHLFQRGPTDELVRSLIDARGERRHPGRQGHGTRRATRA
jgi:thioredoxin reductase/NAD-dependent dihydropyrimidine dehydrogenase PreA subunit